MTSDMFEDDGMPNKFLVESIHGAKGDRMTEPAKTTAVDDARKRCEHPHWTHAYCQECVQSKVADLEDQKRALIEIARLQATVGALTRTLQGVILDRDPEVVNPYCVGMVQGL